jgi:putative ABC transport system ATP-binding protein
MTLQTDTEVAQDFVVDARNLFKVYRMGEIEVNALAGLSIRIKAGEVVAVMGPSGSGKSTLMNILGCLDRPTSGDYLLNGESVAQLNDNQLADVRNRLVGFIFQGFNLLARSTALENVMLPLRYRRDGDNHEREKAIESLKAVGLEDRIHHRPNELSGGQQQRVAIARALVNRPAIVMADEPTGNLDTKSGGEIMKLLLKLNEELKTTLIIVTHDPNISKQAQRIIQIRDGAVEV